MRLAVYLFSTLYAKLITDVSKDVWSFYIYLVRRLVYTYVLIMC